MSFENIKAEVAVLLARMSERPHDSREIEFLLREKLATLRAFGMPLPQDLVDLEAAIDRQLSAEAWQRTRHSETVGRNRGS